LISENLSCGNYQPKIATLKRFDNFPLILRKNDFDYRISVLFKIILPEISLMSFLFSEMSGKTKDRPQLQKMLQDLQAGDEVVVKSLDRLSRSTKDMLDIVEKIKSRGATLKILDMNFDTSFILGEFF